MPSKERASFPRLHVGMALPLVAVLLGVWVFRNLSDPPEIWPDSHQGTTESDVHHPAEHRATNTGHSSPAKARVWNDETTTEVSPVQDLLDPVALAAEAIGPRAKMSSDLLALLDSDPSGGPYRVIVQVLPDEDRDREAVLREIGAWSAGQGSERNRSYSFIGSTVVDLTKESLLALAERKSVARISLDAPIKSTMNLSCETVGADLVRYDPASGTGFDGRGIVVAALDSGAHRYHDDYGFEYGISTSEEDSRENVVEALEDAMQDEMSADPSLVYRNVKDNGRLLSVDFVVDGGQGNDDYGHGSHVLGLIGSNGKETEEKGDSDPFIGVAPRVTLLNCRVLDEDGAGFTSDVLEALDLLIKVKDLINLRVINLSFGHPVFESYTTDPLTLACKAAVEAGISVVCAAGNNGESSLAGTLYGGINSPANAPWVITVGATDTLGTPQRSDDVIAPFSSRGPTLFDGVMKPDLVAPGTAVVSCAGDNNKLAQLHPSIWVPKYGDNDDYIRLSGTSMAAPVVSGTLALMYQANPSLDPATAKFILMYSAEKMTGPSAMEQGSGYLNAEGAVRMADAIRKDLGPNLADGSSLLSSAAGGSDSLEPFSLIAGEQVLFGTGIVYRGGTLVSGDTLADDDAMWGDGYVWADNILYIPPPPGSPGGNYVDPLGLVWRPGTTSGMMGFSDADVNNTTEGIIQSNNFLWRPPTQNAWLGSLMDPTTVVGASNEDVLCNGILYVPPPIGTTTNSIYVPLPPGP